MEVVVGPQRTALEAKGKRYDIPANSTMELYCLLFALSGSSIVDACACVCWGGSLMPASEGEGVCDVEKLTTPFVIADLPSAIKHPLNKPL